jgi:hypothetical protein
MPRNPITTLFILALLSVTFANCTKHADGISGATGPAGQAGANGTGIKPSPITGYIQLYDPNNNPYSFSPAVRISVLKGDSVLAVTTDSSGKFSLPPLPPGNYDLHVTKSGFDSLQIYVQHSAGDDAKFIGGTKMFQSLATKIISQSYSFQPYYNDNLLTVTTSFSDNLANGETVYRDFNYYFSHSRNVTSQTSEYTSSSINLTNGNGVSWQFLLSNLSQYAVKPFHSGDSVYIKTVAAPYFLNQTYYYNYTANNYVQYPYLGDSTITSFKMP